MNYARLALAAALFTAAGCSNDPTLAGASSTGSTLQFHQVDRMGKGSIVFFTPYAMHDTIARLAPSADYSNLGNAVSATFTGAGRSTAIAAAVANQQTTTNNDAVLVPDVLVADLSQSGDASFLGTETNGTLNVSCTTRNGSGLFGGRALTDDAGRGLLSILYGSAIPNATLAPDDGKEMDGRTGTANLANDNVGCAGKGLNFGSFPYLGSPH